jgi:hypothetical protein
MPWVKVFFICLRRNIARRQMMITDPWLHGLLNPSKGIEYSVQAFFILLVCASSKWLIARRYAAAAASQPVGEMRVSGESEVA